MSPAGQLPRDQDQLRTLCSLIRVWDYIYNYSYMMGQQQSGSQVLLCATHKNLAV